jgi:hypothetical protein
MTADLVENIMGSKIIAEDGSIPVSYRLGILGVMISFLS